MRVERRGSDRLAGPASRHTAAPASRRSALRRAARSQSLAAWLRAACVGLLALCGSGIAQEAGPGALEHWQGLPPERQAELRQRFEDFRQLDPEARAALLERARGLRQRLELLDQEMVRLVRSVLTRASVAMAVVLASSPDLVEAEWDGMTLAAHEIDAGEIVLTLTREPVEADPWPALRFSRDRFPGLA